MTPDLEQLPREELVRELRKLREVEARLAQADPSKYASLLRELHLHQVELELQNRELVEAQLALEESRGRYANLYNFAPVGICSIDAGGVIREANLTAAQLLRMSRERLLGHPVYTFVAPQDRGRLGAHMQRCFIERERASSELTLTPPGGRPLDIQLVSVPSEDDEGETCRTSLVDITELKQSEARLRLLSDAGQKLGSSLDYRNTLGAVMHLAVPLFADLCMMDVLNEAGAVERIEVIFSDASLQESLAPVLERVQAPAGMQGLQRSVIESGRSALFEQPPPGVKGAAEAATGSDTLRLWDLVGARSMIVVPARARGHTLGALTFATSASGRAYGPSDVPFAEELARRAAMALDNAMLYDRSLKAVEARENLLAVVSHELQNPLAAIVLRTSEMLDAAPAVERRAETRAYMELVQRCGERMTSLVDDLLDMAKIDRGVVQLQLEPEPLATLVGEALALLLPIAARRRISLVSRLPRGAVQVRCDRERILRVLFNLIGNAIKFTADGGTIDVVVGDDGREARVAVVDRGEGISAGELPHIFERFWRGSPAGKLGTGLGLFISKAIVEAHGGRIWADSAAGSGTTVTFAIPLATPASRLRH